MKKVIALGASNSKTSINKQLATYAASQLKGVEVSVLDLNEYPLPMYGIDLENESGIPQVAKEFYKIILSADAFVISFAEHNGSYAAVFKNTLDWVSRINGKLWGQKPMLLMATSPGARGGLTVLETALGRFPYMGAKVVGSFSLPSFFENFKGDSIVNPELKNEFLVLLKKLQNEL